MMDNKVEKAGSVAAQKKEQETNQAEEATQCAHGEEKQAAKHAPDIAKYAKRSRAAI